MTRSIGTQTILAIPGVEYTRMARLKPQKIRGYSSINEGKWKNLAIFAWIFRVYKFLSWLQMNQRYALSCLLLLCEKSTLSAYLDGDEHISSKKWWWWWWYIISPNPPPFPRCLASYETLFEKSPRINTTPAIGARAFPSLPPWNSCARSFARTFSSL